MYRVHRVAGFVGFRPKAGITHQSTVALKWVAFAHLESPGRDSETIPPCLEPKQGYGPASCTLKLWEKKLATAFFFLKLP